MPGLSAGQGQTLKAALLAAEDTGLRPDHFDPRLLGYLEISGRAAQHGYAVAFTAVTVIAVIGLGAVALLVRKPPEQQSAPRAAPLLEPQDAAAA